MPQLEPRQIFNAVQQVTAPHLWPKWTFRVRSGFPPIASELRDIDSDPFGAEFRKAARLLDHLVGQRQHRRGNRNTQRLGGPQIKTEVKLGLLDRNIADPFALQYLVNKRSAAVPKRGEIHPVRQQ